MVFLVFGILAYFFKVVKNGQKWSKIEIIRLTFSFCVSIRKIAPQMMSQLILIHVGCGLSHLSSTVGEIYAKQFQPIQRRTPKVRGFEKPLKANIHRYRNIYKSSPEKSSAFPISFENINKFSFLIFEKMIIFYQIEIIRLTFSFCVRMRIAGTHLIFQRK